jgi:hypothetical protein
MSDSEYAELGFVLAAVVISAAWNVDWRHYVRYWIGRRYDAQGTAVRVLKIFFAVSFIAALYGLIETLVEFDRGLNGWIIASIHGLIFAAVFFAIDVLFRWRLGPPKP